MTKKIIKVVAAAIYKEGKVLAMQRSSSMTLPGLWEFPGGDYVIIMIGAINAVKSRI